MGLISRVSSRTYRKTNEQTCQPTQERPEKCEAKSATATVELASTENIQVDEVWLVVNITTESTSTSTIQVTSVSRYETLSLEKEQVLLPNHQRRQLVVFSWRRRPKRIRQQIRSSSHRLHRPQHLQSPCQG